MSDRLLAGHGPGRPACTPPHYGLRQAAEAANDHAGTCRALPRELPARPDEDTARNLLRSWVTAP
ncbi:hypothetical protein [Streptomyces griseus]|uniref:hypothetical protein n=1 Tax=Streptomyces griseus TaxID=1911 RepID=UPI00365235E2